MTIQAIETRYAGCRFRSRLEARWAVFFDIISGTWEYEPEGFQVYPRLSGGCTCGGPICFCESATFQYLPDFWLPSNGTWVEVKGSLKPDEALRLLDAAAFLSSNGGAGCGYDNGGHDLIVLGPVPRPDRTVTQLPVRLHMHKGNLQASSWLTERPHAGRHWHLATDNGGDTLEDVLSGSYTTHDTIKILLEGVPCKSPPSKILRALSAARSARFEHGERP